MFIKNLKRFFEPIFVSPGYFWRAIFIYTVFSLYWVVNIFLIKEITKLMELWSIDKLPNYIIIYWIFSFIYFMSVTLGRRWWWAETYYHHIKMIHRKYMKAFNNLDNTYIENIWTGKIISIIMKWTTTWTDLLLNMLRTIVKLIISLTAAFIILYELWNFYIFIFVTLFIIVHVIVYYLNKWALEWRKWRIDTMNDYDRQLVKMIMSKFEILQNNKIDKEIKALDKYTDEAKYFNLRLNNYLFGMFSMPDVVFFIITFSILVFITKTHFSFSTLISVFMILWILKENMVTSIDSFKDFTKDLYIVEKMWALFDDGPKLKWVYEWDNFKYNKWDIKIENLWFSYGDNKVFDDFCVNISWNKKTAFVWISGSGKTTLIKLISGFISPNSGSIAVDWQNLKDINLNSYYQNIWYLTQDPSVFDGTILENLTYWLRDEHLEQEKIDKAIKLSGCEFIYNLKDWVNTEIWERWVRLSGWQKQRLAIAKLFIKDPKIIILDEPTSALDSFSEENINNSLEELFSWRTVLIIAHRLQTVKNADDIILLEHWKIIERWTHEKLIAQAWNYKKMLDLQSGF